MHPALVYREELGARERLLKDFRRTRAQTEALIAPLEAEDMQVQTMADVSPTKWHLAHVTWFFETFILEAAFGEYKQYDERFGYLFNSYYVSVGERWSRPERGLLSRPLLADILAYRDYVTAEIVLKGENCPDATWTKVAPLIELGIHHEQQHQELLLTDIKHVLSQSPAPFAPFGKEGAGLPAPVTPAPLRFEGFEGGLVETGSDGRGFLYDNEFPRHKSWLYDFELAERPVTNGEWRAFMEDGGYDAAGLWLSDGWDFIDENRVRAPMHWREMDGAWMEYTLHGLTPVRDDLPVCHISGYEAAAYAEWAGARLPLEAELETAAARNPDRGQFLFDHDARHPAPADPGAGLQQLAGGVWEWTASSYSPYPGFYPPGGSVGEYNGKFMSGQLVLRGGSCFTPAGHWRETYRNFFPPDARWQLSGVRLAKKQAAR
ncbi:MAG: ergothioneine biosynthesis protein EgtB [Oceanicaulis sp.]